MVMFADMPVLLAMGEEDYAPLIVVGVVILVLFILLIAFIVAKYGAKKTALITIGMAGEMGLAAASIACTDRELRPTRHAGRGGLGAVMGSKGLKAIYLDDNGTSMKEAKDKEAFKAASRKFAAALLEQRILKPDLVIYLQARTEILLQRIRLRGRSYEHDMEASYIDALNGAYSYYFHHYQDTPLLVVNTDDLDFVNVPRDFDLLYEQIDEEFSGTRFFAPESWGR